MVAWEGVGVKLNFLYCVPQSLRVGGFFLFEEEKKDRGHSHL